jgi:hypothetical protein
MSEIGGYLRLDVKEWTKPLEEHADEIQAEREPDDYEDGESDDSWRDHVRAFATTNTLI